MERITAGLTIIIHTMLLPAQMLRTITMIATVDITEADIINLFG
jgi:hypothetical protein